jgi:hypothetical protein
VHGIPDLALQSRPHGAENDLVETENLNPLELAMASQSKDHAYNHLMLIPPARTTAKATLECSGMKRVARWPQ